MKKILLLLPMIAVVLSSCNNGGNNSVTENSELKTKIDSVSYSLGVLMANSLKEDKYYDSVDYGKFIAGFKEFIEGNQKINAQDAENFLRKYSADKTLAEMEAEKQKNEEFMVKNAQNKNVVTTDSGLQYEVLESGSGASPDTNDVVYIHYKGSLIDGTVFDAVSDTAESVKLQMNRIIPGMQQALSMMKEGDKWKIYIPYKLAYGEYGVPNSPIKPYSTLIFEIKLDKVEKQ